MDNEMVDILDEQGNPTGEGRAKKYFREYAKKIIS
jgi:hypothetical protein